MGVHEAIATGRLNRLANLALYHQATWMLILVILLIIKPHYYKNAGQFLGVVALISSFIASRIYIQAGKRVEEFRKFSVEEGERRKQEYFYRFFSPYFLWMGCLVLFSS